MAEGFTPIGGNAAERAWMDSVEERLEQMETQQRLFNSSIKGGAMVVFDDGGNQVARLGVGSYGIEGGELKSVPVFAVSAPSGEFWQLIDVEEGYVVPAWCYNWSPEQPIVVTEPSFVHTWLTHINIVAHVIEVTVTAVTSGTSVASVRLNLNQTHFSDSIVVDVATQKECVFKWDISGLVDIGTTANLRIEAFRDATGSVSIYPPTLTRVSTLSLVPDATSDGTP